MTQIFVFSAGNPDAQRHLADSIENPVDDEEMVFDSVPPTYREELAENSRGGQRLLCMGRGAGTDEHAQMGSHEAGDYVLCVYDNTYHHAARVLAKYDNRRFAEEVWGTTDEGRTWRYMYFLTEPVEVDRRVPEVKDYLNAAYRGFTKIHPDKVDTILNEFGSIDEFIHEVLGGPRGGTGATRVFTPVTQRDIEELDNADALDRTEVDRESTTIRKRLAQPPQLKEGQDPQTTPN